MDRVIFDPCGGRRSDHAGGNVPFPGMQRLRRASTTGSLAVAVAAAIEPSGCGFVGGYARTRGASFACDSCNACNAATMGV